MQFSVVIPARFGSTRLPGKPLMRFAGKTMIEHVYRAAKQSAAMEVIVATDDERIKTEVENFGGSVCMTRNDHESGTDRLQEVAAAQGWADDHIVVNVQGDEPLIPAAVINQVAENLFANSEAAAATLSWPIESAEQLFDPNAVKVVKSDVGLALYFSRAPVPWHRDSFAGNTPDIAAAGAMRHIGIYAYRASVLHEFVKWPQAALETIEKLEQLRLLANGRAIHVAKACQQVPAGVDTEADAKRVEQVLSGA